MIHSLIYQFMSNMNFNMRITRYTTNSIKYFLKKSGDDKVHNGKKTKSDKR